MHSIYVTTSLDAVVLLMLLLAAGHVEGASTPIPSCVNDPASSSILQNTTMSYFEKVALFYSNRDTEFKYRSWSRKNSTSSAPPAAPYLCPQLAPSNVFIPGTYWNFYFEHSAVSNIQNATTEEVTCGLRCSSKSTGVSYDTVGIPTAYHFHFAYGPVTRIINGTSVTQNETYVTDNETTVFCTANVPNTTTLDTVCVAYIQYNSTYSESGTGFALPSVGLFAAGILDPANTTLSAGVASTFSIWLPPSLTFCPWFYEAGTLLNNTQNEPTTLADYFLPRVAPSITIGLAYTLNTSLANNTTIWSESRTFPFIGVRCEVASPHPTSGGVGVRYHGEIPTVASMDEYDGVYQQNVTVTSFNMKLQTLQYAYFLPTISVTAPNVSLPSESVNDMPYAPITYQGTMVPSLSRWWPQEDYTKPALANVLRRCYSSSPRSISRDPTTVYFPTLSCTCRGAIMVEEMINDTSFCCSFNTSTPPAAAFVWPAFIEVYDAGAHWFTDTAGIVATPSPSRPRGGPPGGGGGGGASGRGGDSSTGNDVSGSGYSLSSSSGGPDGQSQSNGEDTALILGISILGISAVVVVMVLVYFKWWKPRQESGGSTMSVHRKHRSDHVSVLSDPFLAEDGQNNHELGIFHEVSPTQLELL